MNILPYCSQTKERCVNTIQNKMKVSVTYTIMKGMLLVLLAELNFASISKGKEVEKTT